MDSGGRTGLGSTVNAEYIALAQLQADTLVTLDTELASAAAELVEVAPLEQLNQE